MPDSLQIALKNDSDSSDLHAYITGIAIQHDGKRCILKSNGRDLYFPDNPPSIGSPLAEDCAISLGTPGNTTAVTVRAFLKAQAVDTESNRYLKLLVAGYGSLTASLPSCSTLVQHSWSHPS